MQLPFFFSTIFLVMEFLSVLHSHLVVSSYYSKFEYCCINSISGTDDSCWRALGTLCATAAQERRENIYYRNTSCASYEFALILTKYKLYIFRAIACILTREWQNSRLMHSRNQALFRENDANSCEAQEVFL